MPNGDRRELLLDDIVEEPRATRIAAAQPVAEAGAAVLADRPDEDIFALGDRRRRPGHRPGQRHHRDGTAHLDDLHRAPSAPPTHLALRPPSTGMHGAGHEGGVAARQKNGHRGDLVGACHASERMLGDDRVLDGAAVGDGVEIIAGHARVDRGRAEAVDADAVGGMVEGQRPGHRHHAAFRRRIGDEPGIAADAVDRGVVDDGAALPFAIMPGITARQPR